MKRYSDCLRFENSKNLGNPNKYKCAIKSPLRKIFMLSHIIIQVSILTVIQLFKAHSNLRKCSKVLQLAQQHNSLNQHFSTQITPQPVFLPQPIILGSRQKSSPIQQSIKTSFSFRLPTKKILKCSKCTYLVRFRFFVDNIFFIWSVYLIQSFVYFAKSSRFQVVESRPVG